MSNSVGIPQTSEIDLTSNSNDTKNNSSQTIEDFLKRAEDFNWWTKDKAGISTKTKLSYMLQSGTHKDLEFIFHNFNLELIKEAFNLIKDDFFKTKSHRRYILEYLIDKASSK